MSSRSDLEILQQTPSVSGRRIRESGDRINVADKEYFDLTSDEKWLAEQGRVYQSFYEVPVFASGSSLFFKQRISPGTIIKGISLSASITFGPIDGMLEIGSELSGFELTIPAINSDRRLLPESNISSEIEKYSTRVSTGTVIDKSRQSQPNGVGGRQIANLTGAAIGGVFDSDSEPYFVYENQGNDNSYFLVKWIWADVTGLDEKAIQF